MILNLNTVWRLVIFFSAWITGEYSLGLFWLQLDNDGDDIQIGFPNNNCSMILNHAKSQDLEMQKGRANVLNRGICNHEHRCKAASDQHMYIFMKAALKFTCIQLSWANKFSWTVTKYLQKKCKRYTSSFTHDNMWWNAFDLKLRHPSIHSSFLDISSVVSSALLSLDCLFPLKFGRDYPCLLKKPYN